MLFIGQNSSAHYMNHVSEAKFNLNSHIDEAYMKLDSLIITDYE